MGPYCTGSQTSNQGFTDTPWFVAQTQLLAHRIRKIVEIDLESLRAGLRTIALLALSDHRYY